MARFDTFDRDIRLATADIGPGAISAHLARFAREELAKAIAAGEATPVYDLFVNGRPATREDGVEAPGPILYEFSWWRVIIRYALDDLIKNSPRKSGRFAGSFIVLVDGRPVDTFEAVRPSSEVIITNVQPYVRKVQVGAMKMSVPPKIFDRARQAIFRKYTQQLFSCQVMFLKLPSGIHPLAPYILKGRQRLGQVKSNNRSGAFRAGRTTLSSRKDLAAGQALTYPALVMNMIQ